ncbi:hypothetical protein F4212_03260 [Candidatus Poribacteria bacterium]|nr:hypothetical protein [Gammaproteobacteria bacterium]MYF98142.1 hypothetical protein [Candidatus Poribacteria bacterium]
MGIRDRRLTFDRAIVALKNGEELRSWLEYQATIVRPSVIRCTAYTVRPSGLRWLARLSEQIEATVKILCDVTQNHAELVQWIEELFPGDKSALRITPVRLGPFTNVIGLFHPKIFILDDVAAVVGSANLTGQALEIGPKPHNVEVSIGLSGGTSGETISQLVQYFDEWWEKASPLSPANLNRKVESNIMSNPEYVIFQDRPNWGIAEVQTEGAGLFGEERWLAISDITPSDPESHPARLQIPSRFVESIKPQPWEPPAMQVVRMEPAAIKYTKEHFWRLAAYWLQAENRQGQLDSLPVLQLRHQTSLVEYLSRPDAPREVLIADEVGLGKTVEIGLLLARLRAANSKLRILYVTPGGLVTNVYDELRNMGIDDLWVFGNNSLDEQKYPQARLGRKEHDTWVVASLHRLGFGSNAEKKLSDTMWDVVIADECHRLRMYGTGDSQTSQKWYRVVDQIVNNHLSDAGRVYFLSGTPHQGNREVFLNLVTMMCRLGRQASQEDQERALAGRVIYRTKEEIRDWEDQPVFPKRDVRDPSYAEIPPEYNGLLNDIAIFFDWLQENEGGSQGRALGFVKSQALQIAASSPKAGFAFLLKRYIRYFGGDTADETLLKWVKLLIPYRHWPVTQKPNKLLEEIRKMVSRDNNEEDEDEDASSTVGPAVAKVRNEEKIRLSSLLTRYASLLSKPEANAKFELLIQHLQFADEPFVVFAQYVDTVYEVKRYVERNGIPCCLIVGGQDPHERRKIIEGFTGPSKLGRRVLVSSSAGGEGINLQCSRRLIHFDLPWNPMVLEQRIGRVHRIGTVDTVIVDTILLKDSREAEIYTRLMQRLLAIVTDLTEDERQQGQYFRRIMAGIPLEILRELFGGAIDDQNAEIGRAVETGRRHVEQVDAELRQHRVTELPEDKGRANMGHLVELLFEAKKLDKTDNKIEYQKVVFDSNSESFQGVKKYAEQFLIRDGRSKKKNRWVVFDREAATLSSSVERHQSGGIDHPIVSVALQSIRTPKDTDSMDSLAVGVGVFDRNYLEIFSGGTAEPVIILSYVTARFVDNYYFDHQLQLFAISESNQMVEKLGRKDGELVEEIIWNNVRHKGAQLACPKLSSDLVTRLVREDVHIRQKMMDDVRDESGRWVGAVWPIAATVLLPQ